MGRIMYLPHNHHLLDVVDSAADVEEAVVRSLDAARLRRHIDSLESPLERVVIKWRFGVGCDPLTHREIAERLRVSLGTAWNLERRALRSLRAAYGLKEAA